VQAGSFRLGDSFVVVILGPTENASSVYSIKFVCKDKPFLPIAQVFFKIIWQSR
jgi:hypothetical protein